MEMRIKSKDFLEEQVIYMTNGVREDLNAKMKAFKDHPENFSLDKFTQKGGRVLQRYINVYGQIFDFYLGRTTDGKLVPYEHVSQADNFQDPANMAPSASDDGVYDNDEMNAMVKETVPLYKTELNDCLGRVTGQTITGDQAASVKTLLTTPGTRFKAIFEAMFDVEAMQTRLRILQLHYDNLKAALILHQNDTQDKNGRNYAIARSSANVTDLKNSMQIKGSWLELFKDPAQITPGSLIGLNKQQLILYYLEDCQADFSGMGEVYTPEVVRAREAVASAPPSQRPLETDVETIDEAGRLILSEHLSDLQRGKEYKYRDGGFISFKSYPYPYSSEISPLPQGFKEQGGTMVLDFDVTFASHGITLAGSAQVTSFMAEHNVAALIHNYAAGEDTITFGTETISGEDNIKNKIKDLLIEAGKQKDVDGTGYLRLLAKFSDNFKTLPLGLVPRAQDMITLFATVTLETLSAKAEAATATASPIQFLSTSATFAVGGSPTFSFTGGAQIDHIQCLMEGRVLNYSVDYSSNNSQLVVTGLAAISNKVKEDAIKVIDESSDTSMVKNAKKAKAGKGAYTLVVTFEDKTKITLTATAE